MGFWDLLYRTKQNAPDMTAVIDAVKMVDNAVRVEGAQMVEQYLSDPQVREKIGRIATNAAIYGADVYLPEMLKSVPGGLLINRIVRDIMDRPPS